MGNHLFATKSLDTLMKEAADTGEHSLRRALGPVNLVTLGIGAIIGAGIFVLTGSAASLYAGPAIMLSYVLAGTGCVFAGLCYAEFASMIPIAGSAYTYGYATLGELVAWIIGWDLILEYAFGAATVASGWSSTLVAFLQDYGISLPPQICDVPGAQWAQYQGRWAPVGALGLSADQLAGLPHATASFNLVAFLAILGVTAILIIGIKESANFNSAVVFVKLAAVLTFIAVALPFVLKNPHIAHDNWKVFLPPNTGSFGSFGWSGIMREQVWCSSLILGLMLFHRGPRGAQSQKDMPIGLLARLSFAPYSISSYPLLTATVHYSRLNIGAPVSLAIRETGVKWGSYVINAGALAGLSTVMLVMLLGQSRVFYSMAHDGLLWKWAGDIHPRFRTPWKSTAIVGLLVAITGSLVPIGTLGQLVSIGTLFAS
jgi:APA family basic amino acid/polyamine antiporter